jgi:hypothetical protein
MLKTIEKARKRGRNEGQRIDVMFAQTHSKSSSRMARRPLYDSIWLAFFELLRDEWALRATATATLSRGGNPSPRQ